MSIIKTLYLFGSRVRGDHRSDSDVDTYVDFDTHGDSELWTNVNQSGFREINALLPGVLHLHQEKDDVVVPRVLLAARAPKLVVGKVVCVELPKRMR